MHKIPKSQTPALLNHRRSSTFSAAGPGCVRTLFGLLAVLSAVRRSIFAASRNPSHPHHGRKRAVFVFAALLLLSGGDALAQGSVACPGGGYDPVPVAVEAVPIVVASTTDDYFVLYVRHDVDGTEVELPVAVKLGEAGTTTLAENVPALPVERYRVEKYRPTATATASTTSPNSAIRWA